MIAYIRLAILAAGIALGIAVGVFIGISISGAKVAKAEKATSAARAETSKVRGDWNAEKAATALKTAAETTRQHEATDEIQRLAAASMAHRAADARIVLAGSLRSAAVAFAAGPGPGEDPAAATSCDAANARAAVLADLFAESDERAGRLAIYADQSDLAGATCRAAYWSARGEAHASVVGGVGPPESEGSKGDR